MKNCEESWLLWGDSEEEKRLKCIISSSHFQGLMHYHPYYWTLEKMIQMIHLHINRQCLLLKWWFVRFCTFVNFYLSINTHFSLTKHIAWNHHPKFVIVFMGKLLSTHIISMNASNIRAKIVIIGEDCI